MPEFNSRHTKSSKFTPAVRPGLILGIMLVLILTACGDQNTPVASQGAAAVGSNPGSTGQGQLTATATPASSKTKTTPKPAATAAKGTAATVHICSLLTKDEVATSLGGTNVEVDASRDELQVFGQANCDYISGTSGLTVQISILGQSKAVFENNFKEAQAVSGLGDASFFLGGQLSTLKGKVGVIILLLNPAKGAETLSNATILTQKILTGLEKTSHASDLSSSV